MIMAPSTTSALIAGVKLSSVVPAAVTCDDGKKKDYELTNMDLALKLHYIKGVYFFTAEAIQGLTIYDLKKPMFPWLALYYTVSGRIRRSESGRPFIKCNDGGVRIVEAVCDQTIEEWMAVDDPSLNSFVLAYDQVLGPDLGFSPLAYLQFTWFKCGGMSVGLSWAHVLGDPFSASDFINKWGRFTQGHVPWDSLFVPNTDEPNDPPSTPNKPKPFSVKRVDPVGDYWVTPSSSKMGTHSFHFTAQHVDKIVSESDTQPYNISYFEFISAIIWKSLSRIREDLGPRTVTICARNTGNYKNEIPRNKMTISVVNAEFTAAEAGVDELAVLILEKQEEENRLIGEIVENDGGDQMDYIAYGANLTFVNMEDADIYGLELNKHKPIYANYTIKGVGDEGAVLVLPARPDTAGDKTSVGRTVTVILPDSQLKELKDLLKKEWGIV